MKQTQFIIAVFFLFALNSVLRSESLSEWKKNKFLISIRLENNFVTITNIEGCGFTKIGFRLLTNGKPIGFNESGMFDFDKRIKPREQNKTAQFSFSIKRNERGLEIEGIEGVEWESLRLNYNAGGEDNTCSYLISQSGLKKQ